ncbi:MAG: putative metal-binding motif-containing protein [Candidatus Goldbacteria bacterium]|nr:putative metal-binding motif-containing protein [Candidatus Goldiibacteriota bacterium]
MKKIIFLFFIVCLVIFSVLNSCKCKTSDYALTISNNFSPTSTATLIPTYTSTITSTPTCVIYYKDLDGDGYGVTNDWSCLSSPQPLYSLLNGDCNDMDPQIYPGKQEACNNKDDNCNMIVDEENAIGCNNYYIDLDSDGYGGNSLSKCLCSPYFPYITIQDGDCNDNNAQIHPGKQEICSNGIDDNCNGQIDEIGCQ